MPSSLGTSAVDGGVAQAMLGVCRRWKSFSRKGGSRPGRINLAESTRVIRGGKPWLATILGSSRQIGLGRWGAKC